MLDMGQHILDFVSCVQGESRRVTRNCLHITWKVHGWRSSSLYINGRMYMFIRGLSPPPLQSHYYCIHCTQRVSERVLISWPQSPLTFSTFSFIPSSQTRLPITLRGTWAHAYPYKKHCIHLCVVLLFIKMSN